MNECGCRVKRGVADFAWQMSAKKQKTPRSFDGSGFSGETCLLLCALSEERSCYKHSSRLATGAINKFQSSVRAGQCAEIATDGCHGSLHATVHEPRTHSKHARARCMRQGLGVDIALGCHGWNMLLQFIKSAWMAWWANKICSST